MVRDVFATSSGFKEQELSKSKGILDDYAVRKDIQTRTITTQKQIIDFADTGAIVDNGFSFRINGIEVLVIGEYLNAYYGIRAPITNASNIFFGVANDTATDFDSYFIAGTNDLAISAPSSIIFQIGLAGTEMTMTANTLTFENGATDTSLEWSTSGTLNIQVGGTTVAAITSSALTLTAAELKINTAGKGISIKEGSNSRMGQATLSSGTVTVSTTAVTASSRIFLTRASVGTSTAVGDFGVSNITAGTSFAITSYRAGSVVTQAGDTSVINWCIIEPA